MPFELSEKPLLLAGPLLRRVEPRSVTVWLASQDSRRVSLVLFQPGTKESGDPDYSAPVEIARTEPTAPCQVGAKLYVISLTITPDSDLETGKVYLYDLEFEATDGQPTDTLKTAGIITPPGSSDDPFENFAYGGLSRPTFSLPPRSHRFQSRPCVVPQGQW